MEIYKESISPIKNEWIDRAPVILVLLNWRLSISPIIMVLLSMLAIAVGIYLSLRFEDWGLLGRFGSIVSILGSCLVSRSAWRRRFKSRFITVTLLKGARYAGEQQAEYILERTDAWFVYIGFFLAAIGSIIWGFADLINCKYATIGHFPCAVPIFYGWLQSF